MICGFKVRQPGIEPQTLQTENKFDKHKAKIVSKK